MNLLTDYHQGKRKSSCNCHEVTHKLSSKLDQSGCKNSENGVSWTWYEITHLLSSQQNQSESEDSEKGPSSNWYKITHILSCKSTIIIVRAHSLLSWSEQLNDLFPKTSLCQNQGNWLLNLRWHPTQYSLFQIYLVKLVLLHIVSQCPAHHQSVSTI